MSMREIRDLPLVLSLPKSLGRLRLKNENIVSAVDRCWLLLLLLTHDYKQAGNKSPPSHSASISEYPE